MKLSFIKESCSNHLLQGRVRTKTVKKTAANIVEKYYQKLAMDFENNKRVCFDGVEVVNGIDCR